VDFNFMADEQNDPPTQSGLESVELVTDIQVSAYSLPALSKGRNVIRYRDETPGEHRVKITHIWRERNDNAPPAIPDDPVFPKHGSAISTLAPNFKWQNAADPDPDDKIHNHCILISFDPMCRWPIATALYKETGSGNAEWQLPGGWLNRDTSYYWKVKAQDSRGLWGEWSNVYRFQTPK
jgi:hypothetical protein